MSAELMLVVAAERGDVDEIRRLPNPSHSDFAQLARAPTERLHRYRSFEERADELTNCPSCQRLSADMGIAQ